MALSFPPEGQGGVNFLGYLLLTAIPSAGTGAPHFPPLNPSRRISFPAVSTSRLSRQIQRLRSSCAWLSRSRRATCSPQANCHKESCAFSSRHPAIDLLSPSVSVPACESQTMHSRETFFQDRRATTLHRRQIDRALFTPSEVFAPASTMTVRAPMECPSSATKGALQELVPHLSAAAMSINRAS